MLFDVASEVARIVAAAEKIGIKLGWLDKVIGGICAKQDNSILIQKNHRLSTRLAELQEEIGKTKQMLTEVQAEMSLRNISSESIDNYSICTIGSD